MQNLGREEFLPLSRKMQIRPWEKRPTREDSELQELQAEGMQLVPQEGVLPLWTKVPL